MAHRWKNDLSDADVTPYAAFLNRRQIMAGLGSAVGLGLAGLGGTAARAATEEALEPNSWEDVTTYCNFYEFGTGKGDPAAYAGQMTTEPWSVEIDGLVERPLALEPSYAPSELPIEVQAHEGAYLLVERALVDVEVR